MDTASGQLGTRIQHQVCRGHGYSIRLFGDRDKASGQLLVTGIQPGSVGNRDTALGQLGRGIQHQVKWRQGYSIRPVGDRGTASGQLGTEIQH
jgi:hypothetical protein